MNYTVKIETNAGDFAEVSDGRVLLLGSHDSVRRALIRALYALDEDSAPNRG